MKNLAKIGLAFVLMILLTNVVFAQPVDEKEYDQYLIKALKDENVGVRTSAAQLLGERKVTDAVDPLVKMVKSEDTSGARIVAAMALYQIGAEQALPTLKTVATNDKNKTVRRVVTAIVSQMESVQVAHK
ncbi:HEAT repeat domain-containing protein [candidate division KSB1 bacterium]|nr:HEAT repeat domain-containing protein [candidate division KSB1 bacterium]